MSNTKQVIVMRKDLKMRRGKEIAQGSHASEAFITRQIQSQNKGVDDGTYTVALAVASKEWIDASFAKVVCFVTSEQELDAVAEAARAAGLECHVVVDSGRTEFHGIATKTCLAVGPDYVEKIDPVTRHLPLY